MAVVNDKYVVVGQPDGFTDGNVARSRVFKKTLDNFGTINDGDTLDASANYAAVKLPPGFIPRTVVANVLEANGSAAAVTVNVAKDATNLASATLAAVNSTADSTKFAAGTAGATVIPVTAPWLTGKDDYIVLTPAAAVDAKFEVVVIGDWPELTGVEQLPKA